MLEKFQLEHSKRIDIPISLMFQLEHLSRKFQLEHSAGKSC